MMYSFFAEEQGAGSSRFASAMAAKDPITLACAGETEWKEATDCAAAKRKSLYELFKSKTSIWPADTFRTPGMMLKVALSGDKQ